MCGIVGVFDCKTDTETLRPKLLRMSKRIRHRGPDWSGIYSDENIVLAHERLAIVDPNQVDNLIYKDRKLVLAVNGEIYNHQEIRKPYRIMNFLLSQIAK